MEKMPMVRRHLVAMERRRLVATAKQRLVGMVKPPPVVTVVGMVKPLPVVTVVDMVKPPPNPRRRSALFSKTCSSTSATPGAAAS